MQVHLERAYINTSPEHILKESSVGIFMRATTRLRLIVNQQPTGGIEEQHCAFASVSPHFSSSVDLDEYGSLLIAECAGFGFIHK